jgi:hypothetical protein
MDSISKENNLENENDIAMILRQTNYTRVTAIEKLREHKNSIDVIKDYMGIIKTEKKAPIQSINQEIYKQLRIKLDHSMSEYREKNCG